MTPPLQLEAGGESNMKFCKGYIKICSVLHPFFCYFLEESVIQGVSPVMSILLIEYYFESILLFVSKSADCMDHLLVEVVTTYFQLRPIYTSENPTWVIVNRIFLMLYISKKILVSRFLIQTLCGNILLFCLIPWRISWLQLGLHRELSTNSNKINSNGNEGKLSF